LEKSLENLKEKNKKISMNLREDLNQKRKYIEHFKLMLKMKYEANLKGDTNKLLKELTIEMYSQTTNCPKDLKPYLKFGDYSTITTLYKKLEKDTEKDYQLLKAELGKNGINEEWFEVKLKLNSKI
jgi:hypothetical protein